jgi:hypothetical protein
LQLQGYNFAIEHRKGSENVVADTLSRSVEEVHIDPTVLLGFETTAFGTEDYKELVREADHNKQHLPDLKVEDGLLFKRMQPQLLSEEAEASEWKLWIPAALTETLITQAHTNYLVAGVNRARLYESIVGRCRDSERQGV